MRLIMAKTTPFDYVLDSGTDSVVAKTWTKDEIKEKLLSDDTWLFRGILAIYKLQTDDEKNIGQTVESNGIGFSGAHSEICSSFARQIKSRGTLSDKQKEVARKIMVRYAGQLEKIANKKIVVDETKEQIKRVARKIIKNMVSKARRSKSLCGLG